jgi:N-acetylglutamate synthase-like GNAT family acetyltransferase
MEKMKIRKATMDDVPQVLYLYYHTFIDTIRNPLKYYKIYIKKGNVMIMENNGMMYGAYVWEINRMKNIYDSKQVSGNRFLWLRQVMVDPKHQGHGLGTQLMLDFMKKADVQKRLVCEQDLVEWYERIGFLCEQIVYHKEIKLSLMIKG